jgi:hypothetical protein
MSFFSKLRGTFETLFQLGKGGPNLKNASGVIEHRDNADAAYAISRGADPVGNNDHVTLQYFNANNNAATGLTIIVMPLALVTKVSSTTIPDNAIIKHCWIDVTTAYDAGATVLVQRTGDATVELQGTADNDLSQLDDTFDVPQSQDWGATGAGTVTATVANSPTVGAANIYIAYSWPNDIS